MLITTADVLARVYEILQDGLRVRWTETATKRFLLDGQVNIVEQVPWVSITAQGVTVALAVGIEQAILTASGRTVSRVLDVTWNQTGSTPSKTVRKMSKDQLDAQRPNWPSDPASTTISYWIPIENEQRAFMVCPAAATGASVRARVVFVPNDADTIEITDAARDALIDYIVWRCWSKDATYAVGSAEYKALYDAEIKSMIDANNAAAGSVQDRQKPR